MCLPVTGNLSHRETCGHAMFYHGLSKASCSRGERRVAILISPKFLKFYDDAGGMPLVHAQDDDDNFFEWKVFRNYSQSERSV